MGVHRVENWSAFRRTVCGGEVRLKPDATYDEVRLKRTPRATADSRS